MFNNSNGFTMPVVPANYGTNNGGFGGFGSDWIGLIVILALLGWGGNDGFGDNHLGMTYSEYNMDELYAED